MDTQRRREKMQRVLEEAAQAVSASSLAEQFGVSRQVIVGDVALLRARGLDIVSTPKGYMMNPRLIPGVRFTVACNHAANRTGEELYAIVDNGGKVLDVTVEHPVYGQIVGQLNIASRYDADHFLTEIESEKAALLSGLTGGIHLHSISCADEEIASRIKNTLSQMNILLSDI